MGRKSFRSSRLWSGLVSGFGVGVVITLVESLKILPLSLRGYFLIPPGTRLLSAGFSLLLGAAAGAMGSPLLALPRGRLWHGLSVCGLYGTLVLLLSPEFALARRAEVFALGLLLLLFLLGHGLLRSRRARVMGAAIALALSVLASSLPHWLLPGSRGSTQALPPARPGAPNIVLVVLDTVRADRLEPYGSTRNTAPWLSHFVEEGVLFERAIAPATWTLPAHASMFTGRFPSAHGAHHEHNRLEDPFDTLAEILQSHGWSTAAFSSNPWLTETTGMTQGFAQVDESWLTLMAPQSSLVHRLGWFLDLTSEDHGGRQVVGNWLRWLERQREGRPFFAFVNLLEAHAPYHQLPPEFRGRFLAEQTDRRRQRRASDQVQGAQFFGVGHSPVSPESRRIVSDLYDGGVLYDDRLLESAIEGLRQRGLLETTIVAVVSDHGELLGEQGLYGHEASLAEALLAVPFFLRYPPRLPAGLRVGDPVSTVSVFATLLDLAGVAVPSGVHAPSLLPICSREGSSIRSPLLSEQHGLKPLVPGSYLAHGPFDRVGMRYRSLEEDGWKIILDAEEHRWLFRPATDPGEREDLAERFPAKANELIERMAALGDALGLGSLHDGQTEDEGAVELDEEIKERLRALGYLK